VRCLRGRVRAQGLGDPRRLALQHGARGLRGHVARAETGAAGGEDDRCPAGELFDRCCDLLGLVRDHPPLDVVPVAAQQLVEQVAARVFDDAARHTVGDREDGGFHSLTFSSSSTAKLIPLSTAFAMS
jgi:hypothetical protein